MGPRKRDNREQSQNLSLGDNQKTISSGTSYYLKKLKSCFLLSVVQANALLVEFISLSYPKWRKLNH